MHEASLSSTVLAVLRRHPGAYYGIRVHVGNPTTPVEDLAATLRVHLDTADPQ